MIFGLFVRLRHLIRRTFSLYRQDGAAAALRRVLQVLTAPLAVKPLGYRFWRLLYARLSGRDRRAICRHIGRMEKHPVISLLMTVQEARPRDLRRAIESVIGQLYPHWDLCIAGDAGGNGAIADLLTAYAGKDTRIRLSPHVAGLMAVDNDALSRADGEFVALMGHDDELSEHALYIVAAEINEWPDADIFYSDEDMIAGSREYVRPFLKPAWDPDLFIGDNYIGRICVMRRSLVAAVDGFHAGYDGCQDFELLLRMTADMAPDHIRHTPHILYHRRVKPGIFPDSALAAARRAVLEQFRHRGLSAEVDVTPGHRGYLRVRYPLPSPVPRVSIIIPTRDRLDLLRQCIHGLICDTEYPDIEIIIVDNGSEEPTTRAYLAEIAQGSVRVLRDGGPFNYSALNNKAVAVASGNLIALLNNDTKVIHRDWLREMASQASRPEVGAVGAKLYFPDGRLQHAGVVVGMGGIAGHLHLGLSRTDAGHYDDVNLVRDVSCATAACLVLRKAVFEEVGGLDAVHLPVAFNDVDLCLKIRAKGYRIVWTPFAELYHFESASRGSDEAPDKIARFQRDQSMMKELWGSTLADDPYYNPNRTQYSSNGGLAFPPRVDKPWRFS